MSHLLLLKLVKRYFQFLCENDVEVVITSFLHRLRVVPYHGKGDKRKGIEIACWLTVLRYDGEETVENIILRAIFVQEVHHSFLGATWLKWKSQSTYNRHKQLQKRVCIEVCINYRILIISKSSFKDNTLRRRQYIFHFYLNHSYWNAGRELIDHNAQLM